MDHYRFVCDADAQACVYKTNDKGNFTRHMRSHNGEKPFTCSVCPHASSTNANLQTHMRTHTGEKPFTCQIDGCSHATTTNAALQTHIRGKHTGERPYKCTVEGCPYAATKSGDLKTHMRTHTGERPYPCTLCPFSATQATALRAHMRTHTGERPFPCQVEGCSFAGKNPHHLKTHMVTHTGERAFSCVHPGCEYAATTAGALVIHQRTHSGERPHVCDAPLCDYQSAQAGNLAQHKLRMHSDKGVQRQKRKENAVMTFLAQHFTVEREVNIEFACGMEGTGRRERARARLDGVIEFPERNLRVIVEVDEEQHKYYSSSVACDNARMMRVCEAVLAGGNTANLLWVRYNPDAYTVAGVAAAARTHTRTQKSERLDALLQLVQTHTPTMPMQVIYLFYDQDSDGRPCILRDAEYDAAFAAHVL